MGGIGRGIALFVIMAPYTGMLILIGYRIGIKYDYQLYSNYYKKKKRCHIEIEKNI